MVFLFLMGIFFIFYFFMSEGIYFFIDGNIILLSLGKLSISVVLVYYLV